MNIKVLLVDDHKIMRDGLAALLDGVEDITVIAEADCGETAINKALEYVPDVMVLDLSLPDIGGIEVAQRIISNAPSIRILVLSMFMDRNCVLECVEAGARGYLVKDCAAEELVEAIRAIYEGKPYFCTGATEIMLKGLIHDSNNQKSPPLTKREQEVLKLTAKGHNTKEIAFELGVSIKMIEIHRSNIKRKLGLKSIAQLTMYAVRSGLITID